MSPQGFSADPFAPGMAREQDRIFTAIDAALAAQTKTNSDVEIRTVDMWEINGRAHRLEVTVRLSKSLLRRP